MLAALYANHTAHARTGLGDLGNFGVMVASSAVDSQTIQNYNYMQKLDKQSELAQPGLTTLSLHWVECWSALAILVCKGCLSLAQVAHAAQVCIGSVVWC